MNALNDEDGLAGMRQRIRDSEPAGIAVMDQNLATIRESADNLVGIVADMIRANPDDDEAALTLAVMARTAANIFARPDFSEQFGMTYGLIAVLAINAAKDALRT